MSPQIPNPNFTKLPTDLKTLVVEHVSLQHTLSYRGSAQLIALQINRPTDLKSLCLTSTELREIAVRCLYREVTIDVGSSKDTRLGAFLSPKNIGLQHIRKLDLYLTDGKHTFDIVRCVVSDSLSSARQVQSDLPGQLRRAHDTGVAAREHTRKILVASLVALFR